MNIEMCAAMAKTQELLYFGIINGIECRGGEWTQGQGQRKGQRREPAGAWLMKGSAW